MIYHYDDVKDKWKDPTDNKIGFDIPIGIADDYDQKIMIATVALNIGYYIGKTVWKSDAQKP